MNPSERQKLLDAIYKCDDFRNATTNCERIHKTLQLESFDKIKQSCLENQHLALFKSKKCVLKATAYKVEGDAYMGTMKSCDLSDQQKYLDLALESYKQAIRYMPCWERELISKLYYQLALNYRIRVDARGALYHINLAIDWMAKHNEENFQLQGLTSDYFQLKLWALNTLKYYKESAKLCELALDLEILTKRPINRAEKVISEEEIKKFLQISNEKIENGFHVEMDRSESPYFSYQFSEVTKIVESPVVGRHMVALEDIPENTVLLQEKPYSLIVEEDFWQKKCGSCYHELKYKWFPCENCSDLVFCDERCYQRTLNTFHKHECGFISVLNKASAAVFHVYRMVSRIGAENALDIQREKLGYTIMNYLAEPNQRTVRELDKNFEEKARAYKMSSILWDHDSKHDYVSNVHHTLMALELAAMLDLRHNFLGNKSEEYLLDFINMALIDIRRIVFNVFGWHEYDDNWNSRGHVANCQCLVGSLINHSCVPNTNWGFENGQITFTTNQFIPKGTEITITYGPSNSMTYEARQERLNHYYFGCRCTICLADGKKGKCLRCESCSGPIPYDSPLQKESCLSAKCLQCFQKYVDFESTCKELEGLKSELVELNSASEFVDGSGDIANRAIEVVFRIADLTCPESVHYLEALIQCNSILRRAKSSFDISDMADKLTVLKYFNDSLPVVFDGNLQSTDALANFLFWVDFAKEAVNMEVVDAENVLYRCQERVRNCIDNYMLVQAPQAKEVVGVIQSLGQSILDSIQA